MELNEKAPDFTLEGIDKDGNEIEFTLWEHLGKPVVLFFYPQDDTPNCTMEAIDFSDHFRNLDDVAEIVGISKDSLESHRNFQEKYDLALTLLSDPQGEVAQEFGLCEATDLEHKKMVRATFLISKDGTISAMWKNADVFGHAEDVMQELKDCF